jgi:plastocyanin
VLVLAGLSTGHKIGLGVVGAVFVAFALASSFLAPRRRAEFPGRNGLSVFILACVVLFAAMLTAVVVFGRESEAKGGGEKTAAPGGVHKTIKVSEKEFAIVLPPEKTLSAGSYTFDVTNVGKIGHDLVVSGPNVSNAKTPLLAPGKSAKLTVELSSGTYALYCSVPGHRAAGMNAKLSIG